MRSSSPGRRCARVWIVCLALPVSTLFAQGRNDRTAVDERQFGALIELRAESDSPPSVRFTEGIPRVITFEVPLSPELRDQPVVAALDFLTRYRDLYRLDDPATDLYLRRVTDDEITKGEALRGTHLFFGQEKNGVPVFAAELGVHLMGHRVRITNGRYLPEIPDLPPASVGREHALFLAMREARGERGAGRVGAVGRPRLVYFNPSLLGETENETHLAWRISLVVDGSLTTFLVDAHTGSILLSLDERREALPGENLEIHSFNNTTDTSDDEQWYDEDGQLTGVTPDAEGQNAFNFTYEAYEYFYDNFQRRSFDGQSALIVIRLDVVLAKGPNAGYFASDRTFRFWDGWAVQDVLTHEFAHAITDHSAGLGKLNESGALDEHYSDFFGAMVDQNWTFGEDLPGGSLRDLSDPPAISSTIPDSQPPGFLTVDHPDHMNDLVATTWDSGGVHINCGIPNKAAWLLTVGGTHPHLNISVNGIGPYKAEHLYYDVLTKFLTTNSQFDDQRELTVNLAKFYSLTGWYGFIYEDACDVENAFAAVGLGWVRDRDCDGAPDTADPDDDADGIPDSQDNCPTIPNPTQRDVDGNGLGDACDVDDDDDGILDDGDNSGVEGDNPCQGGNSVACDDNCPTGANPNQTDVDGNGIGDTCDDGDGDGVANASDNCPQDPNPTQEDADGDAIGDVCDTDADGDGVPDDGNGSGVKGDNPCPSGTSDNCDDNCPTTANADQADQDGDGIGDACDLCQGMASSSNSDTDGDGLGDDCDPDSDDDGVCDFGGPLPDGTAGTPPGGCKAGPCGEDNCRLVFNPDQSSWLGDCVGDACRKTLLVPGDRFFQAHDYVGRFPFPDRPIILEVRPCGGGGCPDWLSADWRVEIQVEGLPPGVEVRVRDERGETIAEGGADPSAPFGFHPAAGAYYRPPAGFGGGGGGEGDEDESFVRRRYFIEFSPGEDTVPGEEFPLVVHSRSGPYAELHPPPRTPVGLGAFVDGQRVILEWNPNPEDDPVRYEVYRSTIPGGPYDRVNGGELPLLPEPVLVDEDVEVGRTYHYTVQAVRPNGDASALSEPVNATVGEAAPGHLRFAPSELFDCGTTGSHFLILDAGEPVAAVTAAFRWEPPDVVAVEEILPGTDVPGEAVALFEARIEEGGFAPGEGVVKLVLEEGFFLEPRDDLRLFELRSRVREAVGGEVHVEFCVVEALGSPPEETHLTAPRDGGLEPVPALVSCGSLVVPRDKTPPELACPEDITVTTDGGPVPVRYELEAIDDCGPTTVTCEPPSGELFAPGTHEVLCVAVDAAGHVSECVFRVNVVAEGAGLFRRGDSNDDGTVDIADGVFTLGFLFSGDPPPSCPEAADANDDRAVDVADAVYTFSFLFGPGASIRPPYPDCGEDPTPGGLGPCAYRSCP